MNGITMKAIQQKIYGHVKAIYIEYELAYT